jgi:hypothetical protein
MGDLGSGSTNLIDSVMMCIALGSYLIHRLDVPPIILLSIAIDCGVQALRAVDVLPCYVCRDYHILLGNQLFMLPCRMSWLDIHCSMLVHDIWVWFVNDIIYFLALSRIALRRHDRSKYRLIHPLTPQPTNKHLKNNMLP